MDKWLGGWTDGYAGMQTNQQIDGYAWLGRRTSMEAREARARVPREWYTILTMAGKKAR